MITSIFILPSILEEKGVHGIVALGIGVLAGGFVQMLVQLPMIFKYAYGPMGRFRLLVITQNELFIEWVLAQ